MLIKTVEGGGTHLTRMEFEFIEFSLLLGEETFQQEPKKMFFEIELTFFKLNLLFLILDLKRCSEQQHAFILIKQTKSAKCNQTK